MYRTRLLIGVAAIWVLPICFPGHAASAANVSGDWSSNLGSVGFRQVGSQVSGTLRYPNGAVAAINGTIRGNTLSFRFSIAPGVGGTGSLALSGDGDRLRGRYTGTGGQSGPFNLTRRTTPNRPPAHIERSDSRPSRPGREPSAAEILRSLFPPTAGLEQDVRPLPATGRDAPIAPRPTARTVPSKQRLALLSIEDLRLFLHRSVRELDGELKTQKTGASWRKALRTETLLRIAAESRDTLPDEATRRLLAEVLEKYDKVDKNPDYRVVAAMLGFRAVHAALEPLSAEPVRYHGRRLSAGLADLNRSLGRINTGEAWRKHLKTEELVSLIEQTTSPADRESLAMMKKTLATYDAVSKNPKYEKIVELAAFAAVHRRLEEFVKAALASAGRGGAGSSGEDRAAIVARLEALFEAMNREQANEQLQTKVLRRIVAGRPGRTNPADVAILKEIKRRFDESRNDSKADEVVQLAQFKQTKGMVDRYLADVDGVNVFRAQFGMQMLLPGSKGWKSAANDRDPTGTLQLAVPEDVVLMPLEDEPEEVEYWLMPLGDVEPEPEVTLVQFSDVTEANKRSVSTWTTGSVSADLNRWSGFVFPPRIDRMVPEAAAGYEPGATVTLVGRYFSVERDRNTIQIMKRLADGSVGVLAELKPAIASTSGTALEAALPGDLGPASLIVRVVVEKDGKSLAGNPVEFGLQTPLAPAPVITGITPNPQSPHKMITVDGRNFGDAAMIELWFHPKADSPLPTTATADRIAFAQVLGETQLYSQVPIGLDAGDYLVACNRAGRLSGWFDFQVSRAPADLAVIDVEALQVWEYANPRPPPDGNVKEEAGKLKNYWYRVRAKVSNVGSSDYGGRRRVEIFGTPSGESEDTPVAVMRPTPVAPLAPGDTFLTEWVSTKKVLSGKDGFRSFRAAVTPADEDPTNDTRSKSVDASTR